MENRPATPNSDRHESIIRENTSFPAGSGGRPSTLDVDLSRIVSQCSFFYLPGVGASEIDNGYDSLCCVLSPSKKEYSGQEMEHCNLDLPTAVILETTDAPEVVEAGKGYLCEQSFVPNFGSGIEEGRGNVLVKNNGDRKGKSSPVKSWKTLFLVPAKTNGPLQFSRPHRTDGKFLVKPFAEAVVEGIDMCPSSYNFKGGAVRF